VKITTILAATALLGFGAAAQGQNAQELAKAKNCFACHAVDKKLVGPAYKEIAAKYKGNKDAAAILAKKIREGGVGVWGQVPMPANPQVNAQEAETLAKWVLSQ
jgi:cytochrome c